MRRCYKRAIERALLCNLRAPHASAKTCSAGLSPILDMSRIALVIIVLPVPALAVLELHRRLFDDRSIDAPLL